MADSSRRADGKRLVGKGNLDPAETDDKGRATKRIKVGKAKNVEGPIRTGEGGGGAGGGSPGELSHPPRSTKTTKSKASSVNKKPKAHVSKK